MVAPAVTVAAANTGVLGVLNGIVTQLLNPFLAPAPTTGDPVTPALWAVLGWVRRNLFNQSPTISYNAAETTQTGQTVSGNIGASDPEGDKLTYTVTQQPQNGIVTIDQATGNFSYTPKDINYSAVQEDSFSVSVSDGNKINLLNLFAPRSTQTTIDVSVLNPSVQRTILSLPDGITNPATPRFDASGNILFTATATGDTRNELYQVNADGSNLECLTCGVSTNITGNLLKPVPTDDGTGRILVQVDPQAGGNYSNAIFQPAENGQAASILPILNAATSSYVLQPQEEMRISPDGTKVLFSSVQVGTGGYIGEVPVVGTLTKTADGTAYQITNAVVVYPTGEGKQWSPDGQSVIILGGADNAGTAEDVEVNLATGKVTNVTANLDYNEDIDQSPNEQWIAVGSMRGMDALTPDSRIVRPNFLPAYEQGPLYTEYAAPLDITNQEWVVAEKDELNGVDGLPLFVDGDGWVARSMPSWNPTGTAVTFWESNSTNTANRLVVANLTYTTSVGPVATSNATPDPTTWAPSFNGYKVSPPPLPALGTYIGTGGGTAVITETTDPTNAAETIRTVTYTNYVNSIGEILNGTESTDTTASEASIAYDADIRVTGTHTGYLQANATINQLTRTLTGYITSDVDGDIESMPDPSAIADAMANV